MLNQWKCTVYSWRLVYYKFSLLQAMMSYGGDELYFHSFLTSSLGGGQLFVSRCRRFTSVVGARGTNLTQSWVGPTTDLDILEECLSLPGYRSTIPRM